MDSKNMRPLCALISVYEKDERTLELVRALIACNVKIYASGGTCTFIKDNGFSVFALEDITGFSDMLGGRVKTLHPSVFAGILSAGKDRQAMIEKNEAVFDIVAVDLYPFEKTLEKGASHAELIEKIDIGGVSLIRAAAKNNAHVAVSSNCDDFNILVKMLRENEGTFTEDNLSELAMRAFQYTSFYDAVVVHGFLGRTPMRSFPEHLAISSTHRLKSALRRKPAPSRSILQNRFAQTPWKCRTS